MLTNTSPVPNCLSFSKSPMATQTDIPAWLTDSDIAFLTAFFDASLNSRMLFSLLFGGHYPSMFGFLNF